MESNQAPGASKKDQVLLLIQLNDLYQINTSADYLDKGALILPRISTFVSRLRKIYEPINGPECVQFCLSGDFLAPSCLSKDFHGEQMVDILNRMGVDFVSFGNHEFEPGIIDKPHIEARIKESSFKWLNANFEFHDAAMQDYLFENGKMLPFYTLRLSKSHLVILFGVLNAETSAAMGLVSDQNEAIESIYDIVRESVAEAETQSPPKKLDFTLVAMTHQGIGEDRELAQRFPRMPLIMGGHDHNIVVSEYVEKTLIVKTASNARTLRLNWIVSVPRFSEGADLPNRIEEPERFRKFALNVFRSAGLKPLKDALLKSRKPSEQQTADYTEVVTRFSAPGFGIAYRDKGGEGIFIFSMALNTQSLAFKRLVAPDAKLHRRIRRWNSRCTHSEVPFAIAPVELRVTDQEVRRFSTNFGNLIADIVRNGPVFACCGHHQAAIGLINSGSFRIDRNIQGGELISMRTLCDVFGHSNAVCCYTLKGSALLSIPTPRAGQAFLKKHYFGL